jgi:hypothetical protein
MQDSYAVSDLIITAIEQQLASEDPVSLALLNAIKGSKMAPGPTLMDKLEAEIEHKIAGTTTGSSNTLTRNPDRNYV